MTPFPIHLMRHGEPELAGRLLGRTDCDATAAGIAACAARARGIQVERLIASDLRRATACARAIGTPILDARWRELDFGEWDGLPAGAVDADALARFWADPDLDPPPGGERWSALVARIGTAIAALDPVPTLVVTHGGAIRAALHLLCGFDRAQGWAIALPYAALVSLDVWPGQPRTAQITALSS